MEKVGFGKADQTVAVQGHVVSAGRKARFVTAVPAKACDVGRKCFHCPCEICDETRVFKGKLDILLCGIVCQFVNPCKTAIAHRRWGVAGGNVHDSNTDTGKSTMIDGMQKLIEHTAVILAPEIVDVRKRRMERFVGDAVFCAGIGYRGLSCGICNTAEGCGKSERGDLAQIIVVGKSFYGVKRVLKVARKVMYLILFYKDLIKVF